MVIDTPGMRELQLWDASEGLHQAFEDIESLADRCAYRDCRHMSEPGCAVTAAVEEGALPGERYQSYMKLQKELRHLERKQDIRAQLAEKKRWKSIHRAMRDYYK